MSVFVPALDVDGVEGHLAEGADEGRRQAGVGQQRYVEVHGGAAYAVAVAQFLGGEVLGYVDDHVDLVPVEQVEDGGTPLFAWPVGADGGDAVLAQEAAGALGGVDGEAVGGEHASGLEQLHLMADGARAHQHGVPGDGVSDGHHGLEQSLGGIVAEAADFAGGRHIHAEHGVGALKAREGELRCLDAHVVEVEGRLGGLVDLQSEHGLGGGGDKVLLGDLADEREGARRSQVALYDLDGVLLGQELDVEWAGDVQGLGDLARYLLDSADGLDIQFLRREADGGVAGMDAGELYVLGDGVELDLAVLGHGVHLDFLGLLDELADDHGVGLADGCGHTEKAFELLVVGAHVHGCAAQDVAGADEDGVSDFVHELVNGVHAGEFAPAGLVDAKFVAEAGELIAVFGAVDVAGLSAEDAHLLAVQAHSQVVGNLAAGAEDGAEGLLKFQDVHDALKSEFVEV